MKGCRTRYQCKHKEIALVESPGKGRSSGGNRIACGTLLYYVDEIGPAAGQMIGNRVSDSAMSK